MRYLLSYNGMLNESRREKIDQEEFNRLLEKHCPNFDRNDPGIYRGIHSSYDKYYLIQPAEFKRKSANTQNYYTWLFDESPYRGEYPKRSESIICSRSIGDASDYGELYRVIPFENGKIAETFESDFWYSFKVTMNDSLDMFNNSLRTAYAMFSADYDNPPFGDRYLNDGNKDIFFKQLQLFFEDGRQIYGAKSMDELYRKFDPEENGFELYENYTEFKNKKFEEESSEIWTDSPCLMIKGWL